MEPLPDYLANISLISYLIVFGFGVLTSFTPCVYPLIPIVVGVIGASKAESLRRNFVLSFSYVLGMAATYAALGTLAAMSGRLFGQLQSSPWAQLIVGCVIIVFALSLLGLIPLPTFLLARSGAGKINREATLVSIFLMGIASGFVVAPCTVAVLGALLAYVATTQNIVFGSTLLFTFALGLGTLLLLLGTFTGLLKVLPKSDKWMQVIQKALALCMIILGGYYIFRAWLLRF